MTSPPDLILPVTDAQVNMLVRWGKNDDCYKRAENINDWALAAPIEQVIAMLMILQVPRLAKKGTNVALRIERVMAELIDACNHSPEHEQQLRDSAPDQMDLSELAEGAKQLIDCGIDVLRHQELTGTAGLFQDSKPDRYRDPPDAPKPAHFLDEDCRWNFNFTEELHRQRNPLSERLDLSDGRAITATTEQARLFRGIEANLDESVNVTGLFGSGKSYSVEIIKGLFEKWLEFRPLLLAQSQAQLNALRDRLNDPNIEGMTFAGAAKLAYTTSMIGANGRKLNKRYFNYQVPASDIARALSFGPVGQLSPAQAARAAVRIVRFFCYTRSSRVKRKHLSKIWGLNQNDRDILLAYAQRLWDQTMEPDRPDLALPVYSYHMLKYAQLNSLTLPEAYTHLIIDEAHDLSYPMAKLIDSGPQAVITMGDPHQRPTGFMPQRTGTRLEHTLVQTLRSGDQIEGIFNALIDKHPAQTGLHLSGARNTRTRVRYYEADRMPISAFSGVVLTSDLIEMAEWFLRLTNGQRRIGLLPDSEQEFHHFFIGLIDLFIHRRRPVDNWLHRHPDWGSLAQANAGNPAFGRLEQWLQKGTIAGTPVDQALTLKTSPHLAQAQLGLANRARNLEFDRVLLTPNLLVPSVKIRSAKKQVEALSAIYM